MMSCYLGNLNGGKCEWKRLASALPQTADGLAESEGFEETLEVAAVGDRWPEGADDWSAATKEKKVNTRVLTTSLALERSAN